MRQASLLPPTASDTHMLEFRYPDARHGLFLDPVKEWNFAGGFRGGGPTIFNVINPVGDRQISTNSWWRTVVSNWKTPSMLINRYENKGSVKKCIVFDLSVIFLPSLKSILGLIHQRIRSMGHIFIYVRNKSYIYCQWIASKIHTKIAEQLK